MGVSTHFQSDGVGLYGIAVSIGDDAVDLTAITGGCHGGGISSSGDGRLTEGGTTAVGGVVPGVGQAITGGLHCGLGSGTLCYLH